MDKVFFTGNESTNDELISLFGENITKANNIDDADIIIETTNFPQQKKLYAIKELDEKSANQIPVLTSSLCVSVSEQCSASKYPERLIGIGAYNTISQTKLIEIAPSKITNNDILEKTKLFFKTAGIKYSIVPDRVGLVFPRILAMIINEAAQVYDEKIASRDDIDTAMKLGTNYPFGPLEWADKIGVELIYNILVSLQRDFGDDRYRPHPSLKEMVNLRRTFY